MTLDDQVGALIGVLDVLMNDRRTAGQMAQARRDLAAVKRAREGGRTWKRPSSNSRKKH